MLCKEMPLLARAYKDIVIWGYSVTTSRRNNECSYSLVVVLDTLHDGGPGSQIASVTKQHACAIEHVDSVLDY
jgi:hypothetical protein